MKLITALVAVVVLIGVGAYFFPSTEEYSSVITEVVTQEVKVEVNPLDEQIKAREAELEEKYNKIQSLEARVDVLKAERDRLDAEIVSLQKELAGFIQPPKSER